ncbi:hypothetical protein [Psychrobacter sp. HII-4]|nr:hypothetical protein [Psychrobacter sp. HII-4]
MLTNPTLEQMDISHGYAEAEVRYAFFFENGFAEKGFAGLGF